MSATALLFRDDAYLTRCTATVIAAGPEGIQLDQTVFYPEGGGQPGDSGYAVLEDGSRIVIQGTRKGEALDSVLHLPLEDSASLAPGTRVSLELDWPRRHRFMRMHSCLHLLCALVKGDVTGGQVSDGKGRLDFNLPDGAPDKDWLTQELNRLINEAHSIAPRWISDTELAANPALVRTMSVKPPSGAGQVRLLEIEGVDLQPCGGTHVRSTSEIGPVEVGKIENKGKMNRRINIRLLEDSRV